MITPSEVREFLNDNEIPDAILQNCIDLAVDRAKRLLGVDSLPNTPEVKKALILLAASELASSVNLYWRRAEDYQTMNVKSLIAEAERLLKLSPRRGAMVWI
jgi:hypothetical protein